MTSCRKATKLISKQLDYPLSINEKAQLLLHLSDCDQCVVFEKQVYSIHNAAKELSEDKMSLKKPRNIKAPKLSPEFKSKVRKVIKIQLKKKRK